jgi:prophage regulatory protein
MSSKLPHGAASRLDETSLDQFEGSALREVTCKVTRAKRPISDLLGIDLDPESSLLALCTRDLCLWIGIVSSITGLSVPTIYREIAQGRFPRPIKITAGARAWKLSEIMNWIETRERDRGSASTTTNARTE